MAENNHIFISYARKDGSDSAARLEDALSQKGFKTWRDRRGLDPKQDFTAQIENAIHLSSYVVICITQDVTRGDSFVRREISYAQVLHKPLIVVRFSDVIPPITVINHTWINFFPNWEEAFTQLCHALRSSNLPVDSKASTRVEDPYRTYLETLYKQIVRYLDKTVFSVLPGQDQVQLLSLHSRATPEAVDAQPGIEAQALPMAFFAMAGLEEIEPAATYTSFQEAFESCGGRMLLLGDPGSGKTTTLMAFGREAVAKRLEDPTQPLPVFAPIGLWEPEKRLALADWFGEVIPTLRDRIAGVVAEGKALLLLDGLDELGEKRRDPQGQEYDPRPLFMDTLPGNNRIVLSSRRQEYYDIGQKVGMNGAVTLMPLDDAHIQQYLSSTPGLWEVLETDKDLREIAGTPLLLSLLAFAFSGIDAPVETLQNLARGDLRDAVFETYIRRRYDHEKRKLQAEIPFPLDEIYNVLGYMATAVATLPGGTIWAAPIQWKLAEFHTALGEQRGQAFIEFATRLHLLISDDKDSVRFIHLLVRDHFAYRYALQLLQSHRGLTRRGAVAILRELRDERSIDLLITALTDKYPTVRWHAGDALRNIPTARAIAPLIRALRDEAHAVPLDAYDQTPLLYSIAADALVNIGEAAIQPLIEALQDENVDIRGRAAEVLGRLRNARAVQPLRELLALSSASQKTYILWDYQSIQEIVLEALTNIGTAEALEAVQQWKTKGNTS